MQDIFDDWVDFDYGRKRIKLFTWEFPGRERSEFQKFAATKKGEPVTDVPKKTRPWKGYGQICAGAVFVIANIVPLIQIWSSVPHDLPQSVTSVALGIQTVCMGVGDIRTE